MEDGLADVQVTFEAARREASAAGFVRALLTSAGEQLRLHRAAWSVTYGLRHQPEVVEGLARSITKARAQMLGFLERELKKRKVPNARIEAEVLFALVEGVSQQVVQRARAYPLDEVIETIASRYSERSWRA